MAASARQRMSRLTQLGHRRIATDPLPRCRFDPAAVCRLWLTKLCAGRRHALFANWLASGIKSWLTPFPQAGKVGAHCNAYAEVNQHMSADTRDSETPVQLLLRGSSAGLM